MKKPKNVKRFQWEVPAERAQQIEDLMESTGLRSKTDFVNNALTLLVWAVREVEAGRVIATVDEQGNRYREVLLPALENVAARRRARSPQQQHYAFPGEGDPQPLDLSDKPAEVQVAGLADRQRVTRVHRPATARP